MTEMLTLTRSKLRALKQARDNARSNGAESFMFDGHELLVRYADYLIEYAETQLEIGRN